MSNYTKTTNFAAKDSLPSGNANKIIKGTEHDTEYNNIATAISTKLDAASGAVSNLTGTAENFVITNLTATSGTLTNFSFSGGTVSNLATDIAVSDGGTGLSFVTAGTVLLGNGSGSLITIAAGTAGNVLLSTGSAWTSGTGPGASIQEFTSSGTWTKPSTATFVMVEAWGAGGGGGGGCASNYQPGCGGGGGGYFYALFKASELTSTVSVTIGAGGTAGTGGVSGGDPRGTSGGDGGNTTFGSYITAYAGTGGARGDNASTDNYGAGIGGGVMGAGNIPNIRISSTVTGSGQFGGADPTLNSNMGQFSSGFGGGAGGFGLGSGANADGGSSMKGGAGGGGGGKSQGSSGTQRPGGYGGSRTGNTGGGAAPETSATVNFFGGGGGAGAFNSLDNATAGGNGGIAAGGGGGGSGPTNGRAGGAGGNGLVRVYSW